MEKENYSYDPTKVNVVADGLVLTGFASDGVITMAHSEDAILPAVGVKGDVAVAENANNTGTATLTFMHTSPSIAHFRNLTKRKKKFRLAVSDVNDDDELFATLENCRVQKMPDVARGKEVGSVSIVIFVPDLEYREME